MDDPFFGALGDGDLSRPGPLDIDGIFDLQPFPARPPAKVLVAAPALAVAARISPRRLPSPETPESLRLVTVKVCAAWAGPDTARATSAVAAAIRPSRTWNRIVGKLITEGELPGTLGSRHELPA